MFSLIGMCVVGLLMRWMCGLVVVSFCVSFVVLFVDGLSVRISLVGLFMFWVRIEVIVCLRYVCLLSIGIMKDILDGGVGDLLVGIC